MTARWDGAPDQGLLSEKGGRGFPYSTIMNADGEVIWEVRPTSADAVKAGLADAKRLQELKQQAAAEPDNAGLAASVTLLGEMGKSQRPTMDVAELEKLRETEGIVEEVAKRFDSWIALQRLGQKMTEAREGVRTGEEYAANVYALYQEGVRPPEGELEDFNAINFWIYTTQGAIAAEDKATATAGVTMIGKMAELNEALSEIHADLKSQAEGMG